MNRDTELKKHSVTYLLAETRESIRKVFELRRQVFCEEQGFSVETEQDGLDVGSKHVAAICSGEVVGCGRIRILDHYAKLERIAVTKTMRGTGIGAELIRFMVEESRRNGKASVKLAAQSHSIPFYRRCGFAPEGMAFEVEGVPHQNMCLELK